MLEAQVYLMVALAGLVSFLSPCVLPLVPPYLGFLGGTTLDMLTKEESQEASAVHRRVVVSSLCFVLGFTTVFVALGASASFVGQLLQSYRTELSIAAGLVIILFGLHFLGLLKISALYRDVRFHVAGRPAGLLSAYVLGLAFAFGWTPCIGPILAAVLTAAASADSLSRGVSLLFVYSLGLGVPFVLAAVAIRPFLGFFQLFRRHLGTVEKVMGAALVLTGILFLTGTITNLAFWMLETFPLLSAFESWIIPTGLEGEITGGG